MGMDFALNAMEVTSHMRSPNLGKKASLLSVRKRVANIRLQMSWYNSYAIKILTESSSNFSKTKKFFSAI